MLNWETHNSYLDYDLLKVIVSSAELWAEMIVFTQPSFYQIHTLESFAIDQCWYAGDQYTDSYTMLNVLILLSLDSSSMFFSRLFN